MTPTTNMFTKENEVGKGKKNGSAQPSSPHPRRDKFEEDGFKEVRGRRGKHNTHTSPSRPSAKADDMSAMLPTEGKGRDIGTPPTFEPSSRHSGEEPPQAAAKVVSGRGISHMRVGESSAPLAGVIVKPYYYRQLANGDFVMDEEVGEEMEMESAGWDPGDQAMGNSRGE